MSQDIGARVATSLAEGQTQREVASQIGMTPDAFSRALNGKRAFSALELARVAEVLNADIHYLVTGEADPHRILVAARHDYDHQTGQRTVPGAETDKAVLHDVSLAYRQAEPANLSASTLPTTPEDARGALGGGFVRPFIERLESSIGVDVVRLPDLSTSYCFTVSCRAVIVLAATGNWFRENWALAHELGHLALGHLDPGLAPTVRDQHETQANAFAAELLLPAEVLRSMEWSRVTASVLAARVWDFGVSIDALARRLNALGIAVSDVLTEWAGQPTQRLLRRHWEPTEAGDPITARMDAAAVRHFALALQDAHLALIAQGALPKGTLAWMLGVDPDNLEVDEPAPQEVIAPSELASALGL